MKLEVGMYVRTDDGYIFKIKELLEKGKYNDSDNKIVQRFKIDGMYQKNDDYIEIDYMYSDWVIKASYNIIELIEVGDYVNGIRVNKIEKDEDGMFITIGTITNYISKKDLNPYLTSGVDGNNEKLYQLKSIVTKEQFESMSYKVEVEQ